MAGIHPTRRKALLLSAWLLIGAVVFGVAAPRTDAPGLYYDEAFMAQQAADFFTPDRFPDHAGSVRQVWLLGRPIPFRNAVYLGSLKSQLAIPAFAVFGVSPRVLRLNTLFWSWLAVGFVMLWTGTMWGAGAGVLSGALLASDPAWYFFSLHEWGPFTTGLLCRVAGLWFLVTGWSRGSTLRIIAGGAALGLGVYNRADFAVILAAGGVGLLCAKPGVLMTLLKERRAELVAGSVALSVAASPMIISVINLFQTSSSGVIQSRGGLEEKLRVLWSVLDGSRYYRIIDAGGRFEQMFSAAADAAAPWSPFGWVAALAAVVASAAIAAGWWARDEARRSATVFVLVAGALTLVCTLAVPGAVRAHHQLNAMPLPHILVAAVAATLWSRSAGLGRGLRHAVRACVVTVLAGVFLGNASAIAQTYGLIGETGGRGRFSDAIHGFARELEAVPGSRAVSLDWGFHEPLLFLTRETALDQPIWRLPEAVRRRGEWLHAGSEWDHYVVHDTDYDLMGFGPRFLETARELSREKPELVEIRTHRDREGGVSFLSVRLKGPHRVRYAQGRFRIEGI